jgi:hypothetical protein
MIEKGIADSTPRNDFFQMLLMREKALDIREKTETSYIKRMIKSVRLILISIEINVS